MTDTPPGVTVERGPYRDDYLVITWNDATASIVAYTHDGLVIRFPRGADPGFAEVNAVIEAARRSEESTKPGDDLAEMRRQYRHAQADTHMLVDGRVRLRCGVCKIRPMPPYWGCFQWCDECMAALRASGLTIDEFLAARRADPNFAAPTPGEAS